jgi:RNA polymerase sigma-70 factor (ECF subfamily)
MDALTPDLLACALAGGRGETEALVDALVPVVQARVARALLRQSGRARGRDVRQEVADMTQEVFAALFADGARALRAWDAARGLSLKNFVGLLAEHEVAAILRSGRRSPWWEDPTEVPPEPPPDARAPDPERLAADRELLRALLDALRARLSPLGLALFHALMVEQRPVDDVCREHQMTADAVYAWRSRLARLARQLAAEMASDQVTPRRTPERGARP